MENFIFCAVWVELKDILLQGKFIKIRVIKRRLDLRKIISLLNEILKSRDGSSEFHFALQNILEYWYSKYKCESLILIIKVLYLFWIKLKDFYKQKQTCFSFRKLIKNFYVAFILFTLKWISQLIKEESSELKKRLQCDEQI